MVDRDELPTWRKSRRSSAGACVEIMRGAELILMRHSKDPDGTVLAFERATWAAFLLAVKAGEFDLA
ncbi:DUF397 domain-containing protein [Krasilnikovia sp. MM14-A1259]|uniref:DUF397 domain-containing protein n=1 Tax=Krasilnikovia sp. MM14-A1259 TaxID=3373539 RepID=UPI0037F8FB49